jgi:hypothetical protein
MLLQLAILFIHSLRCFLLGVALHLFSCAVRTYVEQLRQIKHPHLSVVCFLKNVLRTTSTAFLLPRCVSNCVRFAARGAHSTHPFQRVKQFAKLIKTNFCESLDPSIHHYNRPQTRMKHGSATCRGKHESTQLRTFKPASAPRPACSEEAKLWTTCCTTSRGFAHFFCIPRVTRSVLSISSTRHAANTTDARYDPAAPALVIRIARLSPPFWFDRPKPISTRA